MRHWFLWKQWR